MRGIRDESALCRLLGHSFALARPNSDSIVRRAVSKTQFSDNRNEPAPARLCERSVAIRCLFRQSQIVRPDNDKPSLRGGPHKKDAEVIAEFRQFALTISVNRAFELEKLLLIWIDLESPRNFGPCVRERANRLQGLGQEVVRFPALWILFERLLEKALRGRKIVRIQGDHSKIVQRALMLWIDLQRHSIPGRGCLMSILRKTQIA